MDGKEEVKKVEPTEAPKPVAEPEKKPEVKAPAPQEDVKIEEVPTAKMGISPPMPEKKEEDDKGAATKPSLKEDEVKALFEKYSMSFNSIVWGK